MHRHNDPVSARWLARDPIGYAGDMNLYGYVQGNPVMSADASGLKPPSASQMEEGYGGYIPLHVQAGVPIMTEEEYMVRIFGGMPLPKDGIGSPAWMQGLHYAEQGAKTAAFISVYSSSSANRSFASNISGGGDAFPLARLQRIMQYYNAKYGTNCEVGTVGALTRLKITGSDALYVDNPRIAKPGTFYFNAQPTYLEVLEELRHFDLARKRNFAPLSKTAAINEEIAVQHWLMKRAVKGKWGAATQDRIATNLGRWNSRR